MGLTIARSALRSRAIRRTSTGGRNVRKIDLTQSIAKTGNDNFIFKILDGLGKFVGFITKLASKVRVSVTTLSQFVMERIEELKAFDWNATDIELRTAIASYNVQMAAIWGSLVGRGVGYLATIAVGVGVGLVVPVIGGAALAGAISVAVSEEAVPDLLAELSQALQQTVALKAKQFTISAYINIRRLIKQVPIHKLIQLPGIDAEFAFKIKNEWGAEGAPVLSFNKAVGDRVEKIQNPITQAFVENALEDSWDTFVEGTFIIAQSIDDFIAAQQIDNDGDGLRAVEVLPDKDNPDEKILFYGRENSLIGQIMGTLNTHQFIHNRDVGFSEEVRLTAIPAPPQKRTLRIILYSSPSPPWRRTGERLRKAEHLIPDPKPSLTWQEIKRAVGGSAGMKVGGFAATVRFANRRQMTVRGDTKDTAIANARKLAELSESQVLRVHISENVASRQTPASAVTVYGAFIHIGKVIPDATSDRQNMDGQRYREEKIRHPLWIDDAPGNLRELFT